WQMLQQNLFVWFYAAFIHRVGTYLIEMNSGRLRVGAERYRELLQRGPQGDAAPHYTTPEGPRQIVITLVGQVKAGKSSLINALLGERRALADVLPATAGFDRYELAAGNVPAKLVLLDTPGYGHEGPKADQLKATQQAAQEADIVFLVLHAKNPARQADAAMLKALNAWFSDRPQLRRPAVIAVLTHIDLLSPSLEWSPPYN